MPDRQKPDARRESETLDVLYKGGRWHVTVSRFPSGAPQEVFLHGPKAGSDLDAISYSVGVLISFALQHGASLADVVAALPRLEDGTPADFVTAILEEVSAACLP